MNILHLVDRLEELFNASRGIWFTHQVIVDEDRMLDLIDQMRVSIPEEVKKSQQILSQKDRILAQAQEEGNRTLQIARDKSDKLVERDVIVQAANARADQIINKARRDADAIQRDTDKYVFDSLNRLYREMERIMQQVHNGIAMVEKDLQDQNRAKVEEVARQPLEMPISEKPEQEKESEMIKEDLESEASEA